MIAIGILHLGNSLDKLREYDLKVQSNALLDLSHAIRWLLMEPFHRVSPLDFFARSILRNLDAFYGMFMSSIRCWLAHEFSLRLQKARVKHNVMILLIRKQRNLTGNRIHILNCLIILTPRRYQFTKHILPRFDKISTLQQLL